MFVFGVVNCRGDKALLSFLEATFFFEITVLMFFFGWDEILAEGMSC